MPRSGSPTHLERLLALMPLERAEAVAQSPELFIGQQVEIILRGVSRGMDYLSTVPALFTRRGWPHHEDALAFVTAAVCFYRWGQVADPRAFDNRFTIPPSTGFNEAWRRLHALVRPTARQVVDVLELHELAPPGPGVRFTPVKEPVLASES